MDTHDLQVMVDIETLGIEPGAVILSIGACVFSLSGKHDDMAVCGKEYDFYCKIDIANQQLHARKIEAGTLRFWMDNQEAWTNYCCGGATEDFYTALSNFDKWFDNLLPVWSHGPSFDIAHLENAYRHFNKETPWKYNSARDTRTIFSLADLDIKKYQRSGTYHNALDDARFQATMVQKAYQLLFPDAR